MRAFSYEHTIWILILITLCITNIISSYLERQFWQKLSKYHLLKSMPRLVLSHWWALLESWQTHGQTISVKWNWAWHEPGKWLRTQSLLWWTRPWPAHLGQGVSDAARSFLHSTGRPAGNVQMQNPSWWGIEHLW